MAPNPNLPIKHKAYGLLIRPVARFALFSSLMTMVLLILAGAGCLFIMDFFKTARNDDIYVKKRIDVIRSQPTVNRWSIPIGGTTTVTSDHQ
jgi:hypothetical protein